MRRLLLIVIGVAIAASLAGSILLTASNRGLAFFVTQTRIWELGLGALLALAAGRLARIPHWARELLGVGGIIAIGASLWVFSDSSSWPSCRPLLPCLGAAAVIVAGLPGPKTALGRLLSIRPMTWVGGLSYSLYLWHWPMLVGATAIWGELGIKRSALVIAISFIPAWVVHTLVENPIRYSRAMSARPSLALSVGANFTLVAAGAGLVLCLAMPSSAQPSNRPRAPRGAAVIADDGSNWPDLLLVEGADRIVPKPAEAVLDLPLSYSQPCQPEEPGLPKVCVLGDPNGDVVIAAVGDSMIQQWEPAFDIVGKRNSWRIESYTKSSCQFSPTYTALNDFSNEECNAWAHDVLDRLVATSPTLVIQSQGSTLAIAHPDDPFDTATSAILQGGLHSFWSELAMHGIPMSFLLRNPIPTATSDSYDSSRIYDCVASHPDELRVCVSDADFEHTDPQRKAAESSPTPVAVIDMNSFICGEGKCPAVVGEVLIYRQGSHMTKTYVESLAPRLEDKLRAVLSTVDALATPPHSGN